MSDEFEDLRRFFDPDLRLPVGGKEYRVPCPTAEEGLKLKARLLAGINLTDDEELDILKGICGEPLWKRMQDELPWQKLIHVARTAMVYYGYGPEAGEMFWEKGLDQGNPVPPPPAKQRVAGALNRLRARRILGRRATTETGTPAEVRG